MLALTNDAEAAIRGIVDAHPELPDDAGLRITVEEVSDDTAAVNLAFVEEGEPGDTVAGTDDAPVFLDSDAALLLDDKVLDATIVENRIAFAIVDPGESVPTFSPDSSGPQS